MPDLVGRTLVKRYHVNAFIVELEKCVVVVDATLALSSARELRIRFQ